MFRLGILLIVCAGLAGCSAGAIKEINEKAQAVIDSRKLPDAQLTQEQINQLRKPEGSKLVWLKAGVQTDGNIFVCYVAVTPDRKSIFGQSWPDLVTLHSGIFEGGRPFKDLSLPLISDSEPLAAQHNNFQCLDRGIQAPVRQVRASELRTEKMLEELRRKRATEAQQGRAEQ